jgi:hypothetical protein
MRSAAGREGGAARAAQRGAASPKENDMARKEGSVGSYGYGPGLPRSWQAWGSAPPTQPGKCRRCLARRRREPGRLHRDATILFLTTCARWTRPRLNAGPIPKRPRSRRVMFMAFHTIRSGGLSRRLFMVLRPASSSWPSSRPGTCPQLEQQEVGMFRRNGGASPSSARSGFLMCWRRRASAIPLPI